MRMKSKTMKAKLPVIVAASLLFAAAMPMQALAQDKTMEAEEGDASQAASDTWITTKVKTDLMATSNVPGTTIDVETVNGRVSLAGTVDSKASADKAVTVAKGIKGVKSVDASALKVAKK
ncbi:BON domain-containing protein [Lysobacter sp. TAF61]